MFADGETRCLGDPMESRVECFLGGVVELEVGDVAATVADEVVVMAGQVLGQFVARELVGGDDPAHCTDLFENGEIPIHARLWKRRVDLTDLADCQRLTAIDECFYEAPPTGRVALISLREKPGDFFVDIGSAHSDEDSERLAASNSLMIMIVMWIVEKDLIVDPNEPSAEGLAQVLLRQDLSRRAHGDDRLVEQQDLVATLGIFEVMGGHDNGATRSDFVVNKFQDHGS